MKYLLTLICVATLFQSYGQADTIKRNAVFLTYEEFRTNTPSIHPVRVTVEQVEEDKFTAKFVDPGGNVNWEDRNYWGFSDSSHVYIKHKNYLGRFMEIDTLCVFKYRSLPSPQGTMYTYNAATNASQMQVYTKSKRQIENEKQKKSEEYFVLDTRNGEITKLTPAKVKKLIKADAELLEEYKWTGNPDGKVLEYIREYNKRRRKQ